MSWEDELFTLFDDLEGQAAALHDQERAAELADRSRSAYAEVTLASRLVAAVGLEVGLTIDSLGRVDGRIARVGDGWLLLVAGPQEWVVNTSAIDVAHGAPARSVPEVAWSPLARLTLTSALRRLGESGATCVVHLRDGTRQHGVVRRVGADFVEVEAGERGAVVLVAFAALVAVQSRT